MQQYQRTGRSLEILVSFLATSQWNLFIFNDAHNLQFVDAITNWNQFRGASKKTPHDWHFLFFFHVSLIILSFKIKQLRWFCNECGFHPLLCQINTDMFFTNTFSFGIVRGCSLCSSHGYCRLWPAHMYICVERCVEYVNNHQLDLCPKLQKQISQLF